MCMGIVWCTYGWADPAEDGVRCYAPNGDLIGRIHLPETPANLTFGGPKRNRLMVCASTSLYSVYLNDIGAQVPYLDKRRATRAGWRFDTGSWR